MIILFQYFCGLSLQVCPFPSAGLDLSRFGRLTAFELVRVDVGDDVNDPLFVHLLTALQSMTALTRLSLQKLHLVNRLKPILNRLCNPLQWLSLGTCNLTFNHVNQIFMLNE